MDEQGGSLFDALVEVNISNSFPQVQFSTGLRDYVVFAMVYNNMPVENYSLPVENPVENYKTLGELAHWGLTILLSCVIIIRLRPQGQKAFRGIYK